MTPLQHIGCRHIHLDATDSTNTRVAEFAHDPVCGGIVVTADLQTRGRGQQGRVWESPSAASVLLSTLLFPPPELRRPVLLTAFAAVAVAETIAGATGLQARIKWPNDVLLDGKKVCGVLIECGSTSVVGATGPADHARHAIVGIGLNVNQTAEHFARLGLPDATSLLVAAGQSFEVKEMTGLLIRSLDTEYGRLVNRDWQSLEERWRERLDLLGKPVAAELMDASEARGRLTELTFYGLALAQADGAMRRLRPEEVRHLRAVAVRADQ